MSNKPSYIVECLGGDRVHEARGGQVQDQGVRAGLQRHPRHVQLPPGDVLLFLLIHATTTAAATASAIAVAIAVGPGDGIDDFVTVGELSFALEGQVRLSVRLAVHPPAGRGRVLRGADVGLLVFLTFFPL